VAVLERKILALSPTPEDVCRSLSTARLGQILRAEMPEEEARELCRITKRPLEDLRGAAYGHLLTRAQKENPEAYEQVVELEAILWRSQYEGTFTYQKAYETQIQVITSWRRLTVGPRLPRQKCSGCGKGTASPSRRTDPQSNTAQERRSRRADDAGEARQGTATERREGDGSPSQEPGNWSEGRRS
jgi:hypothetical protein